MTSHEVGQRTKQTMLRETQYAVRSSTGVLYKTIHGYILHAARELRPTEQLAAFSACNELPLTG